MSDTFLSPEEIEELTGVKIGKTVGGKKRTREDLQIEWLRASGIPFWPNARGRPIVARAAIEGRKAAEVAAAEPKKKWQPATLTLVG
ncbi:DUF4224 domain-containing protein [Ralstonia pickettii]|uniref:DUF4224 domain-containing protein n=1 Tax=Ralstonia pickettii TaxID=329 RepID=UPI0015FB1B6A|nr:DUF4224 domain-containing protein [Ralstonia pickettii]MBB0025133.1 DUF4224 domain-containing protein [Ralstonia pickettii]MBB0034724.1 DUF4224 domain-containing protein [Ralstonia pickettii]MBB0098280.1 DUF4224 domain-containing protein [Ralstonia pickettii]MBB0108076.1 DUF4224 domain-containing protein [Ralstonia pickettii]MBB0129235.1 DUF4224 domain-containing protein [Ralstonia pickettii]